MAASDYVKEDAVGFGRSFGNLVNAIRDGVGAEDFAQLMFAFEAGAKAVNEARDVPAAFGTHALSGAGDVIGDQFLADAIAAEEASV